MAGQEAAPLRRISKADTRAYSLFESSNGRRSGNGQWQRGIPKWVWSRLLRHSEIVQLIERRSIVGVRNAQIEGQVAPDLPVVSNIEESVVFLETQFWIALFDNVNERVVVDQVAETVKNI